MLTRCGACADFIEITQPTTPPSCSTCSRASSFLVYELSGGGVSVVFSHGFDPPSWWVSLRRGVRALTGGQEWLLRTARSSSRPVSCPLISWVLLYGLRRALRRPLGRTRSLPQLRHHSRRARPLLLLSPRLDCRRHFRCMAQIPSRACGLLHRWILPVSRRRRVLL